MSACTMHLWSVVRTNSTLRRRSRRVVGVARFVAAIALLGAVSFQLPSQAATSGWTVVTSPSTGPGADDIVLGSSCANSFSCWAVGVTINNISSNSTFSPLVEHWNGTSWNLAPSPPIPAANGGGLFSVTCINGSDCWAVGAVLGVAGDGSPTGSLAEHWDGNSWSIVPSPTPDGAVGVLLQGVTCTSTSNCWAVGFGTDENGQNLHSVTDHWDGTTWSLVAGGATGQAFDQLSNVRCLSGSDCWADGNAGPVQQNPNFLPIFPGAVGDQGLLEHWDGLSWSVVPSPSEPSPGGGYLNGLACVSPTDCWASGAATDATGMASGVLMEHWDGSGWSIVPTAIPASTTGSILSSISCTNTSQCWAVGSSGSFGGGGGSGFQPSSFIENWNGSAWSIDPSPNVTALSFLNSITCSSGTGCWAVGSAATEARENDPGLQSFVEHLDVVPATSQGIVLAARDGGVFTFGNAPFLGSMAGQHLNKPVVGIATTPDGGGYWLVAADGGVFTFGDARFFGSTGGQHLNELVVGITPTPDGGGYWLVASDGGVFSFGDARFYGSMGAQHVTHPIVGMATTADGGGYWLVASDGGVFTFGDAPFFGSTGGEHLNSAISAVATTPDGGGYWLVASDGGVFTFGNARYEGSVPGQGISGQPPVVGITRTPSGAGYWLVGTNGAVYGYGDAAYLGSTNGTSLAAPISGVASS
jgi:hypothetical protein